MKLLINGMTMTEHMEVRRTTEYQLKKEMGKLENLLNHLKKHKYLYMRLVFIVSMMIMGDFINPTLVFAADVDQAIDRINTLGEQLLKLTRVIAYWTTLLITSKDCIKEALSGNRKNVGNVVVKGIMIMAVIYFLPELFSMMESIVDAPKP